jgi:outer membrane protein assembly factor BamD (BamD/ComL family)
MKTSSMRQVQAEQAAQLLEQANRNLQAGEQTKARRALNSVANQYALDARQSNDFQPLRHLAQPPTISS